MSEERNYGVFEGLHQKHIADLRNENIALQARIKELEALLWWQGSSQNTPIADIKSIDQAFGCIIGALCFLKGHIKQDHPKDQIIELVDHIIDDVKHTKGLVSPPSAQEGGK